MAIVQRRSKYLRAIVSLLVVMVLLQAYTFWRTTLLKITDSNATYNSNNNQSTKNGPIKSTDNASSVIQTLCGRIKNVSDVTPPWPYFQNRFKRMNYEFQEAVNQMLTEYPNTNFSHICNKKINIFVGHVLTVGMDGANGAPQGDIMQWSDVIQALHFLGCDVEVHRDYSQAKKISNSTDQLWIDYYSSVRVLPLFSARKCIIRFIDAFGTQTKYNQQGSGPFCCRSLPDMKQYMTFVPNRAPENTFLGFAVPNENRFNKGVAISPPFDASNLHGIVWGKNKNYIDGKIDYLESTFNCLASQFKELASVMTVHLTMQGLEYKSNNSNIISHGFLSVDQYNKILDKSLFFIGMEQPLFGHGAIEATMKGLIYLNPMFDPPWNNTHNALRAKPTEQIWTSQHPFLETLNTPWIINVNFTDKNSIIKKMEEMKDALSQKEDFYGKIKRGFIPAEYTTRAFLQRIYDIAIKTDFCK